MRKTDKWPELVLPKTVIRDNRSFSIMCVGTYGNHLRCETMLMGLCQERFLECIPDYPIEISDT